MKQSSLFSSGIFSFLAAGSVLGTALTNEAWFARLFQVPHLQARAILQTLPWHYVFIAMLPLSIGLAIWRCSPKIGLALLIAQLLMIIGWLARGYGVVVAAVPFLSWTVAIVMIGLMVAGVVAISRPEEVRKVDLVRPVLSAVAVLVIFSISGTLFLRKQTLEAYEAARQLPVSGPEPKPSAQRTAESLTNTSDR